MKQLTIAIILAAAAAVLVAQESQKSDREEIRTGLSVALERGDKLIAVSKPAPPPPAPVKVVKAGESLQAALNAAKPGDTLALEAGAKWVGNFVLPKKDGDAVITITSTAADKLPARKRVSPADAPKMPKIISTNGNGALNTAAGAHHYKLVGLELAAPGIYSAGLLRIGTGEETAMDQMPHDIVIERVYVHGDPVKGSKRGIQANARNIVIRDSYLNDHKSEWQDTQAIACWNCDHVRIENNFAEATGENIFILEVGSIPGYIPHDIEIVRNHMYKPLTWKNGTETANPGKKWAVKNGLELKAGINVLISGNVIENSWTSGQTGNLVNLKPGGGAKVNAARTENVVFENNLLVNGELGIAISGTDPASKAGVGVLKNVTIRNNAFVKLYSPVAGRGLARLIQVSYSPADNITVENNTMTGTGVNGVSTPGKANTGWIVRNNLMTHGTYGWKGDSLATGTSIPIVFPGIKWESNVFLSDKDLTKLYPAGTKFVPVASVQFASDGYTQTSLPGIGVDAAKLDAAIKGVR